jgi:hypothetical protein
MCAAMWGLSSAVAQPLTTSFTYQGSLIDGGAPANGVFDLRFRLYDQSVSPGGSLIGPILCVDDVTVVNGVFSTQLDFGAVFAGQRRFLEVAVRPGSAGSCAVIVGYTALSPRQEITAAPNAAFALSASSLNGQPASFYTNAANLSAGTIPDARLSANVATTNAAQTFSGVKTFSAPPSFTAVAGAPFVVSTAALVSNLNADLLDGLSSAAFATAGHTHDGSAITSGLLNDARLSTNIPRLASVNAFTAVNSFSSSVGLGTPTPTARLHVLDSGNLPSTLTEASVAPFKVTNGTGGGILMDSNQIESVGGPLFLNFRGGGMANDISMAVGGGRVGIGTATPVTPLEIFVAPTQSFQFRQDGSAPGMNVVSPGSTGGVMRLRNAMEIWPSDNAARAGKLDVRNTSGNATISLDGATGNATYNNQPAIKTVVAPTADDTIIQNNSITLIEEALVNIPAGGFLHITCQAPVNFRIGANAIGHAVLELKETTGPEVLIAEGVVQFENGADVIGSGLHSMMTVSHTIPVTTGQRRFKLRLRHSGAGAANVNYVTSSLTRPSITLMYFPRGL